MRLIKGEIPTFGYEEAIITGNHHPLISKPYLSNIQVITVRESPPTCDMQGIFTTTKGTSQKLFNFYAMDINFLWILLG